MPNVPNNQIISRDKIVFPPLHIKLGLMKQLVKALRLDSECFYHLVYTFPALTYEKIKAGVFHEPQIRTLVRDQEFFKKMNAKEKAAWLVFADVMKNFLGNKKAQNYEILVSKMLIAFRDLGCKYEHQSSFSVQPPGQIPRKPWGRQ